jgi:hypothetical protein
VLTSAISDHQVLQNKTLKPLPVMRRRPQPPPYVPCGSRCDLLDRMK